jgi:hypothetical protein
MANSQFLGNGIGMLYVVASDGATLISSNPNTPKGVRDMRTLGASCAPIAAVRSAVATVTFTATPAGNVTAVTINAVNQIGANVAMIAGNPTLSAIAVANAINVFTPSSGPNYTAQSVGAVVYIFSPPADGFTSNGLVVTVSVSTVAITFTKTDFSGGSNETGVYDSVVGLRFWFDERGNATRTSFASGEEVTKYMVLRGLQTGIVTKSLSVNNDKLTGIDRSCAITNIFVDTQSSAATDELSFIETVDFVEGDVIKLSQFVAGRVVVVTDNTVSVGVGNLFLTDGVSFNCQDNKSIELQLRYDPTLGPIWVENGRSISGGAVQLTRIEMRALIAAGAVQQGQSYFIADVGQAGIIVSGIDSNSITSQGDYIGYFPDYQNVSGDYQWMWSPIMIAPTVAKLYATGGFMYESVTGAIGTNPTTDTTNWLLIQTTDSRYQKLILTVQYDIDSNIISQGSDGRGNIVNGSSSFNTFKWGSDSCISNIINDSNMNINSIPNAVTNNIINNSSMPIVAASYCLAMSDNNVNRVTIDTFTSSGGGFTFSNNQGSFDNLTLSTGAANISFINCLFVMKGKQLVISGNGYTVSDCIFGAWSPSVIGGYNFSTFSLRNSQIAWPYLTLDQNETQLFVNAEMSNHVRTIDLDGSAWVLNALTISSQWSSCGTIRLTAATTKTIDKVIEGTGYTRSIVFQPVNTVSAIMAPTAVASAVANNIVSNPTTAVTLVGRTNGADYYEIKRNGTFWSKVNSLVHA